MEFRKEVITVTSTRDRQIYMDCHGKEHKYDVLAELLSVLTTSLDWRWIIVFCRVSKLFISFLFTLFG